MPTPPPISRTRRHAFAMLAATLCPACLTTRAVAADEARYSHGVVFRTVRLDGVPAVTLTSMSGAAVRFDRAVDAGVPVLLNFIFTTCSSTCSMQTAVLAQLQQRCAEAGRALRLVSVTIDPDNDTPEQLRRFSKSFDVRPGWEFLTGRFDDLLAVQRHFDVYRGSKASHPPVMLVRGAAGPAWTRIEGAPSAADLMLALRGATAGA